MGSGWSCTHGKGADPPNGVLSPRNSPFGKLKRSLSSRTSATARATLPPRDRTLLDLALGRLCECIADLPAHRLDQLPPDLAQALLDRLVECGALDEGVAIRLGRLSHHRLALDSYPGPVTDEWLVPLVNPGMEIIKLGRSAVTNHGMMQLGLLPRLKVLHLQYCQGLTDASLSVLQGLPALEELNLAGLEHLTCRALEWLRACPRLAWLSLELCAGVRCLDPLRALPALRHLDLGWCGRVGDAELGALAGLRRLACLRLGRTRVTDAGLAALPSLPDLRVLGLPRTAVTGAGLAGLLPRLPALRELSLARCPGVRDDAARALAAAAPPSATWT
ncbi:hypothetical protein APUTEX25_004585 [Auxenochlorella protothecoides]|uniref:F-box/LRR-repeat protein 14 n=1 Tax=Auxenochlorella protothecoides TaxID=3075 RepID=A0A3M7L0C3_AUXPR|nr:hypothetical protein APUTEX25_004585 [Auxenochlorella protothecoides]|eukprot:RMZ56161.1 hypothetical protein APUTEX25_004585 [Auxenochlorella protothecoides]